MPSPYHLGPLTKRKTLQKYQQTFTLRALKWLECLQTREFVDPSFYNSGSRNLPDHELDLITRDEVDDNERGPIFNGIAHIHGIATATNPSKLPVSLNAVGVII